MDARATQSTTDLSTKLWLHTVLPPSASAVGCEKSLEIHKLKEVWKWEQGYASVTLGPGSDFLNSWWSGWRKYKKKLPTAKGRHSSAEEHMDNGGVMVKRPELRTHSDKVTEGQWWLLPSSHIQGPWGSVAMCGMAANWIRDRSMCLTDHRSDHSRRLWCDCGDRRVGLCFCTWKPVSP